MLELEFLNQSLVHRLQPTRCGWQVLRSLSCVFEFVLSVAKWNDLSGRQCRLRRPEPRAVEHLLVSLPLRVDPVQLLLAVHARLSSLRLVQNGSRMEFVVALEVRVLCDAILRCSGQVGRRLEAS